DLNLKEARKSIQLADNVKIVTQLAFVFLPLTFSSAIFGMNVKELGSGSNSLWVFVLVSLAVGLVTLLVWSVLRCQKRLRAAYRRCRDFVRGLSALLVRSPRLGCLVWFYIFSRLVTFDGLDTLYRDVVCNLKLEKNAREGPYV